MDCVYHVSDCKGRPIISTRDFDFAMYIYATADKRDGWPRFSWTASSEARPAPAIPGYPDVFLSRQAQ